MELRVPECREFGRRLQLVSCALPLVNGGCPRDFREVRGTGVREDEGPRDEGRGD